MFTLILLFTILAICAVSWLLMIKDSKRLTIKGPFPYPVIGNAHLLAVSSEKLLVVFKKLEDEYGNIVRIYLLSYRYMLLSDPKHIEAILSSNELITKGRSYEFIKPWLGLGLLTSAGQRWRTHRKLLTPTLHFNILQNFLPVFCKNEKILCKKLHALADGKSVNVFPLITLAALDNVTESIMAACVNAQTDRQSEYVEAVDSMSNIISMRMRNSFVALEPVFRLLSLKKQQDRNLEVLHRQSKKVIEARKEELKKSNVPVINDRSDIGIKNKHAFLDLLLLAEVDGEKMKDEHIREEVDTFMFEGHDTVSSGISFGLYCLSKHKDVQDKVFEEQKSIFGDDLKRDPTFSELSQMKYLDMVIKESLRIYPSVPLIERFVTQDTDLDGTFIPANTSVVIDIFNMQRNPDIYPNPLKFDPERFDSSAHRKPFDWLPFSAGPRNCIGQRFAMMELKTTLAGIVKVFELLPSEIKPNLAPNLIMRSSTGINIRIRPRKS